MFIKVDNVGAERMSSWRLLQAAGPATQMPKNGLKVHCFGTVLQIWLLSQICNTVHNVQNNMMHI